MSGLLGLYRAHAYHRVQQQEEAARRQERAMEAARRAREAAERDREDWLRKYGPHPQDVFQNLMEEARRSKLPPQK